MAGNPFRELPAFLPGMDVWGARLGTYNYVVTRDGNYPLDGYSVIVKPVQGGETEWIGGKRIGHPIDRYTDAIALCESHFKRGH